MRWLGRPRETGVFALLAAAAAVVVLTAAVLVGVSVTGSAPARPGVAAEPLAELPADADIAGRATFDKPSYLPGEFALYQIRILWRADAVTPDLDSFRSGISYFPFDYVASRETRRRAGGGLREYVREHRLQAVDVESPGRYQFDMATVYYSSPRSDDPELKSLRIVPPPLYVGGYYPENIAGVQLKPPRGAIPEAPLARQLLMTLLALGLLAIAAMLTWRFGRKRPRAELSESERLWQELRELGSSRDDGRESMLGAERIFTRALTLRSGIRPAAFWSGRGDEFGKWRELISAARQLFADNYRGPRGTARGPDAAAPLVERLLEPLVSAERLRREQEPGFIRRLKQKRGVFAVLIGCCAVAIAMLALAAMPSAWIAADVKRYNEATRLSAEAATLDQALDEFVAVADATDDDRIRAASLYNFATLSADPRLSYVTEEQHREFLRAIFLPQKSLDGLLHALEMDAEAELLTLLADMVRRFVEAEAAVRTAVRLGPEHEDSRRNMEIIGKVRRALADTLTQLARQAERSEGPVQMQRQSAIDIMKLMETELPRDFAKLDAGKDDSDYLILEGF